MVNPFNMWWRKSRRFVGIINRGYGEYRLAILSLTALGFLSSFLDGLGVTALIPLFAIITGATTSESNVISRWIENFFHFFHLAWDVKFLLVFMAALFVLRAVVLVASAYLDLSIVARYQEALKRRLMSKMLKADWPHLMREKLGHLETVLMVNAGSAASLLGQVGNIVIILASLAVYITIALNISAPVTLIAVSLGGALFLFLRSAFGKIKLVSAELERTNKEISHHISENVLGLKTIKAMNVAEAIISQSNQFFARTKTLLIKQGMYGVFRSSLLQPASVVLILVLFAFSYKLPGFNLASFLAVMYLIKQIFSYIEQLQKKILSVNSIMPYFMGIMSYEEKAERAEEAIDRGRPFHFATSLVFNQVSFAYQANRPVLDQVSFTVHKGEMVGLIGPSGAGKTTLVDLLLRLLTPTTGDIFLDGVDIRKLDLADWRRHLGYVSQDIFLINDTIENNIKFYDQTITTEQVVAAAKMANIYDFVLTCPQGLQTVVGERGMMLSAGQRQRLVIARILARQPHILILDEATSALDRESELKIQEVIRGLRGKVTVLVIAHRLSTITNADRLLAIEDGRIVEEGVPQQLLADKESYFYRVMSKTSSHLI